MTNPFETLEKRLNNIEILLVDIKHSMLNKSTASETEQFLNIEEAAEMLNLSVATIYRYVQKSQIPVCKKGKRLYFSKNDLGQWLMSGRIKTLEEVNEDVTNFLNSKK